MVFPLASQIDINQPEIFPSVTVCPAGNWRRRVYPKGSWFSVPFRCMDEVGSVTDQVCSNHLKSLWKAELKTIVSLSLNPIHLFLMFQRINGCLWDQCERGAKHYSELIAVWVLFGSDQKSTRVLNNSLLETADRCWNWVAAYPR